MHEREVLAVELAVADQLLQRLARLIVARYDEQAGRIAVEAVHDARALLVAAAREATLGEDRRERGPARSRRGVRDQANRLVDNDQPVVLVRDDRLQHLGHHQRLLARHWLVDLNAHASADAKAAGAHVAIDPDEALIDEPLRLGPRAASEQLVDEPVEPRACLVRPNVDRPHASRARSPWSRVRSSRITPQVMAASARLNTGKLPTCRKSVT